MNEEYFVPFETSESEFIEKRSRFISHVWRVNSEEEARTRIEETRKHYYDARHNCWCYIIKNGGTVRYSDDGEPQGTAGQPMLNVFQKQGVFNACCVVTRYFGGILLGAGGLTRAYTRGASDALAAAGMSRMSLFAEVLIEVPYALFERVKLELLPIDAVITDTDFGAAVMITALMPRERTAAFQERLTELSAGTLSMEVISEKFCPGGREEVR